MNKTKEREKCKEILYKYKNGQFVNSEDFDYLMSIFQLHQEWDKKKGVGVENITTETTTYGNKCFLLIRPDGSTTDISFYKIIENYKEDKSNVITKKYMIKEIYKACREAISFEIKRFKSKVNYGVDKCPISNITLNRFNTHIDHYNLTFNDLLKKWLIGKDVEYLFSTLNESEDNETSTYFTDDDIIIDFITFHNNNTHLRAINDKVNLKLPK